MTEGKFEVTGFIFRGDGAWVIGGSASPNYQKGQFGSMANWKGKTILFVIKCLLRILRIK